ncbi:hypothetical protein [Streptomyces sp. NPDC048508]|uniref:hypothetical protein n=1 Tax=Streptomyces sp. NPDC048508 TaxID=3365561 RepID=UPI0037241057
METAQSSDSEHSNASSYHSVRVRSSGNVDSSSRPVPDTAPDLPARATTGMYDQGANTFYAVDVERGRAARWNDKAKSWGEWLKSNKSKAIKAVIDVAPTLIQGASKFVPEGRAATAVNAAGVAAQGLVAGYEMYGQGRQYFAGGHVDGTQIAASTARLVSAGLNAYGAAAADQDAPLTRSIDGAGTWVAAAATTADLMHHAEARPTDLAPGEAQVQMYGLHNNPNLGNQPGQVPAGWNPSPPASSVSSFSPPAGHVSRRTTAETSSSAQKAQKQKVVKKSGGGGPSH